MRLERDPKQRRLDENYIRASRKLAGHFYVLTNGEHTGNRGVNTIVDQSFASWPPQYAHEHGLYLPGLAAGGVQWQDCFGSLAHPGVTPEEMDFLRSIPNIMETELSKLLKYAPYHLNDSEITKVLSIIVLGNMVSPTVNIGSLYDDFADNRVGYIQLQTTVMTLMSELLERAKQQGL
ncbi:MAG: glucosylglycerol 3-phosphatase, partial [Oleibacter sp.]|nr:glucosylglycerol 3-phosphatase [Thalassolituus sp.]